MMQMKLFRLYEVDCESQTNVGNMAENFNRADYTWLEPEYVTDDAGNNVSTRQKMEARVVVGKPKDGLLADFAMTTNLFVSNATVTYGNDSLGIPVGGVKFSIDISGWPWKNESATNCLKFGVKLKIKSRFGNHIEDVPDRLRSGSNNGNLTKRRYVC
ncbi:hypothetical protein ACHAWF_003528 [Thalassiosira exigua]